jgi:heptosyltransferase III
MKRAAVLPSKGIGDALLMMIASQQLLRAGFAVTTFHPVLKELSEWFPGHRFAPFSLDSLSCYDLIIAENDNSPLIVQLKNQFPSHLSIFYPTYSVQRHPPLTPLDRAFFPEKTMVDNISTAIFSLLNQLKIPLTFSSCNGLKIPAALAHRAHPKRVALHATSSAAAKNWQPSRFLKLSKALKKKGYHPVFILSPQEKETWLESEELCPHFPTLDALARYLYESGYAIGNDSLIGHLASNMNLPTLIIANDIRRMHLWRPGWRRGEVVTPSLWIPNVKGCRLRERFWKAFISVRRVVSTFDKRVASQK